MSEASSAFSVGQKVSGKIIQIEPNAILVEIEPGVVGIIPDVEKASEVIKINDDVEVRILGFGASGEIYLEWALWQGWTNMAAGHRQAVTLMSELRNRTDAFRDELERADRLWKTTKSESQQIYDAQEQETQNTYNRESTACENDYSKNRLATESRRNRVTAIIQACDRFAQNLSSDAIPWERQSLSFSQLHTKQKKVEAAIDAKIKAYRELRDCILEASQKKRDDALNKFRAEQIEREAQADRRFEEEQNRICAELSENIQTSFNENLLRAYSQNVKSAEFNTDMYECRKTLPDSVVLGSIGYTFPKRSKEDMTIVHAVEKQSANFGTSTEYSYTVMVPYCQRLREGISLMISYSSDERNAVRKMMQPLLLKLFMSFPPGNLEATMIDPIELGGTFPDIPRLGEMSKTTRVIDTKIWSKESDIERVIATLRQKIENMTTAYGKDIESRLKKEVIYALAITDFPTGFNDTALKDLRAIVRNSADHGVCVLISANEDELEKVKQRNEALLNEISESLVSVKAVGENLEMISRGTGGLFLRLDDMSAALKNKDAILTQIRDSIERSSGKIEPFEDMYKMDIYDSNNWFCGNHNEIAIPLGIKGVDSVVKMVMGKNDGSVEHHALIAGSTGAGKSTLLHTIIMSTMLSYSPDEVQMYLLDFKEGVEFNIYTQYRLPSLRVVAINSEREFGLSVLKELCSELEKRINNFSRNGVADIDGYTELTDVPKIPRVLLIFDEVQELFRSREGNDSIASECLSCINRLVMQGRAVGIHLILACQDFRNCSGLEAFFSQMAIRIAIKGSEPGAASVMQSSNSGIAALQKSRNAGEAIYNDSFGAESANNFFQVSYLNSKARTKLLQAMDEYYRDPDVAEYYSAYKTRVLLTNADDDINNCFNQLIHLGLKDTRLAKSEDSYGLLLGQGFGKENRFTAELRREERENLLIAGRDEKTALSMFELSAMSLLYEDLHTSNDKSNALIYIIDIFTEETADGDCDFDYLEGCFRDQIKIAKMQDIETMISAVYNIIMKRADGSMPGEERLFFMIFGIGRARVLRADGIYGKEDEGLGTNEMLRTILTYGPSVGVNSIIFGENIRDIEEVLGNRYQSMFNKRIAYGLDDDSMYRLVDERDAKNLKGKTAVYKDVSRDTKNTHFRPYEIPSQEWVRFYAERHAAAVQEEDELK